jgi:hypothetical protein
MPYPGVLRGLVHVRPSLCLVEPSSGCEPTAPLGPALPVAPRLFKIARLWSLGATLLPACLSTALLAGCATLSPDAGLDAVQRITRDRTGHDVRWNRTDSESEATLATVRQILQRPLSVDDVVQTTLINNRGLATYAGVGIGETELVQASWPRNPGFAPSQLQGGGKKGIERSFTGRSPTRAIVPWRRANYELGAVGGHAGHAMNRDMSAACNRAGGSRTTKPTHIAFVVVTVAASETRGRGDA